MRGTPDVDVKNDEYFRITPAHAGNTSDTLLPLCSLQDHPRPCGEHLMEAYRDPRQTGSPPPMRGTQLIFNK